MIDREMKKFSQTLGDWLPQAFPASCCDNSCLSEA